MAIMDLAAHVLRSTTRGALIKQTDSAAMPPVSGAKTGQLSPQNSGAAQVIAEQTEPVTPLAETGALPEETLKEINDLSTQALSAAVPTERGKAIVKLRSAARSPESIQALSRVVSGDQSAQNRMLAVTALLNMARQGDADGAIKEMLRQASADYDPRVAMRAQSALASLVSASEEVIE